MNMNYKIYQFENEIRREISALSKLDNWHCFLAILEDYMIIFLMAAACSASWYLYPLAALIIGSRQRALATLLHEASHNTLAKNKLLNFVVGTFFSGYFILQTMGSYRESHVKFHHGHFGNTEVDPDYKFAIEAGWYEPYQTQDKFTLHNIILPFFLAKVPRYLYYLIKHRLLDRRNCLETIVMIVYLGVIASLFIGFGWGKYLFLFWIIPYLTTFQIISWFIEMSEHYPLMSNQINLYMSRNRHSQWLENLLTGMHNENYHLVHHLNPAIPFWNIPKAHQIYLQDKNYALLDRQAGGIFISANNVPSLIQSAIITLRLRSEKKL